MNHKKFYIVLLLTFFSVEPSYLTYDFSNGRFGDNLLAYSHARWISYKYDIPLLYRPFKYSDQLELHLLNPFFELEDAKEFQEVVTFKDLSGKQSHLDIKKDSDTLYIIPYFPECKADIRDRFHFDIDWNDTEFIAILQKEFTPLDQLSTIDVPKNKLLVALHIRTGAGHDRIFQLRSDEEFEEKNEMQVIRNQVSDDELKEKNETQIIRNQVKEDPAQPKAKGNMRAVGRSKFADRRFPLKFPPNEFYIEQIQRMSELLDDQPMYVHIFTDSTDPQAIADLFKKHVNKPNIEFGCRSQGNQQDANVLDDFFALTHFDYMIRGESNFSIMAERIGYFKIIIKPADFVWRRKALKITKVDTKIKDNRNILQKVASYVTATNIGIALGLYWGMSKLRG